MFKSFLVKLKESCLAVFPITIIIFALIFFLVPTEVDEKIKLLISAFLLLIGMALFTLGADSSMQELGENVGSSLSKSKKIWFMILCSFIIGFIITFAEPDLMVLATQVAEYSSLSSTFLFIATVSLGVGIFLMFAILRILFKWRLSVLLSICYGIILTLSFFVPKEFMPIAFDSGSVTTGPISVPFLISFGLGIAAVRSGKNEDDSFGLIAFCSAGPILAVMIMSLFLKPAEPVIVEETISNSSIFVEMGNSFLKYLGEVALVLLPIVALFIIFQIFSFKFPKRRVIRMCMGFIYTYIGIVMFLTGVECGYLPIGSNIGEYIGLLEYNYIAIPIGFVLGAFAIMAEPALHVLKKQVEDITGGVLKQRIIVLVISIGVACSVMMAVIRALYQFNLLYILLPVYVLSLALSFFNTKLFTAVAFDSGGVATGAMAVSFILPLVTGLSPGTSTGFGTIALIAAFPILTMQILGFIYKLVLIKKEKSKVIAERSKFHIIEFNWEEAFSGNLNASNIAKKDYKKDSLELKIKKEDKSKDNENSNLNSQNKKNINNQKNSDAKNLVENKASEKGGKK